METQKGYSNKYFLSDNIFHEEILGKIEDSIGKNQDYTDEQKNQLIQILYSNFYHATKLQLEKHKEKIIRINF